jgi:hypothetical protein
MIYVVILLLAAIVLAVWRVADPIQKLADQLAARSTQAVETMRSELSGSVEVASELSRMSSALRQISVSVLDVSKQVQTLVEAVRLMVPKPPDEDPHQTKKEPWQIENEKRSEIALLTENLTPEQMAVYVSDRYSLRVNDPWVVSVVKARDAIGRDAAITMLRNRDKEVDDGTAPPNFRIGARDPSARR